IWRDQENMQDSAAWFAKLMVKTCNLRAKTNSTFSSFLYNPKFEIKRANVINFLKLPRGFLV
ncbi:MAG TPA: hypothetical protein VEQ34_03510, partial [Pyrinomonadaceae bacterium]|nr:hypothetical protein [Pyrinomonadaceae bacterium]